MTATEAPAPTSADLDALFGAFDKFNEVEALFAEADAPVVEAPVVTAHCTRCGRVLRSARSIADGMGRTCKAKVAAATQAAALTTVQAAKVAEAIELGAVSHRVRNLFQVVSSRGDTVYDVDLAAGSCTCPAGQHGRRCYHLDTAAVLSAA